MLPAVAIVIIILIALGGLYYLMPAPVATGTSGGVTAPAHPQAANVPSAMASAPVVVAAATPPKPVKKVKGIIIQKNTEGKEVTPPASRTFQIGEIKAYRRDGSLLTAKDYAKAEYNKEVNTGVALTYPATNAIDGDVNTFTHTNGESAEFGMHILFLTLKEPTDISRVEVFNRVDCCADRLDGAVLIFTNEKDVITGAMKLTSADVHNVDVDSVPDPFAMWNQV